MMEIYPQVNAGQVNAGLPSKAMTEVTTTPDRIGAKP